MKFLILGIILFIAPAFVFAEDQQEISLPKTSINPGSFYYPVKRLFEKGRERLIFSQEGKASFYSVLLKNRLSELKYVTDKKVLSEIQGSSERFAYHAGILTEVVEQGKSGDKENIIREFEKYSKFLEGLRDNFPANSSFWMLIQHDINTLSILSAKLK